MLNEFIMASIVILVGAFVVYLASMWMLRRALAPRQQVPEHRSGKLTVKLKHVNKEGPPPFDED